MVCAGLYAFIDVRWCIHKSILILCLQCVSLHSLDGKYVACLC